jgi:hypothetical protein
MDSRKIEKFWWMLGLTNMVHKACIGKSGGGGIALFWRNGVDVIIHTMSKYFINVMITSDEASWQLSRLYGEPNLDKKDITWRALHVLNSRPVPWLCMGDFNEVLFQYEKQGGRLSSNVAWACLKKRLKIVAWRIWVTQGICSLGVIIITMWKATFGKDLIEL